MSINIGGAFPQKITTIKNLLNTFKPAILSLAEVKISVEDFDQYEHLFTNYQIYYSGHYKNELQDTYESNKINKINGKNDLNAQQKEYKILSINRLKAKGKDGVAVFVNKNLSNNIKFFGYEYNNRGITLSTNTTNHCKVLLHFIYGPADSKDKQEF